MRLVNETKADTPFYVGNCKNNVPPKHVAVDGKITEGNDVKDVTVNGEKGQLIKSKKSPEYIYLKLKDQWLWIKDANIFETKQTDFVNVPKAEKPVKEPKAPKEKKEKAAKTPKGDTPESIGLELERTYNVYGTQMTGEAAKKRFGIKNLKDGMQAGKVTLVKTDEEQADEAAEAAEAASAGDTGAA